MGEQFNKTLSNFVKDFACRNEVIAKVKNRKPISEIVKELTFPISKDLLEKLPLKNDVYYCKSII